MLSGMHPREFEELYRDYLERPWGDEWLMMSRGATAIINEIRCQLNEDVRDENLLKADALVPKVTDADETTARSLEHSLAFMRACAGV